MFLWVGGSVRRRGDKDADRGRTNSQNGSFSHLKGLLPQNKPFFI